MSKTTRYRDQHDDLLKIASEISMHLNADNLSRDASEVRSLLSRLLGTLNIHLAMEDNAMYPHLLNHANEQVRSTAARFVDEMGSIGKAVNTYKDNWATALMIQKDPQSFIEHTKGILDALARRIEKENNELYKLVDEL